MGIGIIGTSIWQQNMPLLENLTIDREQRAEILQQLKSQLGLSELVYLATCNRIEFIYTSTTKDDKARLLHGLIDFFFSSGKSGTFSPNDFYHYTGMDAVTHLFRTTSSLESLVLGENQITAQIKSALQDAIKAELSGNELNSLIREALAVSRKVKSKTSLSKGAVSMASLASTEMCKTLKSIKQPSIALVGSGPMQGKLAKYINENLSASLLFVNRTVEKAQKLAEEFDGRAVSLEEFQAGPDPVDAIVSATAAPEPIFNSGFLGLLLQNEKNVVCVDLAVPRDFSDDFNSESSVTLIDIPFLKSKCQGSMRQKFIEAGKASEIVQDAVNNYLSSRIEVSLKPAFHDSYKESMELAQKALDDLFTKRITSLPAEERDAVSRMVTKLIGQSTFGPIKKLSRQLIGEQSEDYSDESRNVHREAV
jgi:glutamyl-tRNA reductase